MSSPSRFGRLATAALGFLRRHDWLAFLLQQWHMGALFLASGERFGSAWADSVSWTLLAMGLGGMLFWRRRAEADAKRRPGSNPVWNSPRTPGGATCQATRSSLRA